MRGPYATLDRVTDPASRPRSEGDVADPRLTAGDLVEATGGRVLAESARPILGGAVDSREVVPGNAGNRLCTGALLPRTQALEGAEGRHPQAARLARQGVRHP